MLFRDTFNALLDNMIPILITHASHYMTIKLLNHFDLLIQINNFNSLSTKKDSS